jgi:hypothetical protein
MADSRFFRIDYPDFLRDELANRFNRSNATSNLPKAFAHMTVFGYDPIIRDYTIKTAKFELNTLVEYATPAVTSGQQPMAGQSVASAGGPYTAATPKAVPTTTARTGFENITISDVKMDIGGRVGQLSKAEVTIIGAGRPNLEIVTNAVTQIGNKATITIQQTGWSIDINDTANRLTYTGRIYDFSFNFVQERGRFSVTIKLIGLAEALSNINALPEIDPNKRPYPSKWPKTFKPKDQSKDIPINNLLMLLDALWTQELNNEPGIKEIPGVSSPKGVTPYLYIGSRAERLISDSTLGIGGTKYNEYINLEGLRVVAMKFLNTAAQQANNNIASKLNITYPENSNGDVLTDGSISKYLDSADPEKILLFNNTIIGSTTTTAYTSEGAYDSTTRTIYYSQPPDQSQRYQSGKTPNMFGTLNADGSGDIANIYISRNVIFQAAGAKEGDTRYDVAGNKSIEKFFQSIFETIRNQTGNIINLALLPDLDSSTTDSDQTDLYIVDTNFIGPSPQVQPKILQFELFPRKTNHFKDVTKAPINLTGAVPKSLATKAFVKDANLVATSENTVDSNEANDTSIIDANALQQELTRLRNEWPTSTTPEDDSTKRREIMSKLWQRNITDDNTRKIKDNIEAASATRNIQTALSLSMESIGINGWQWGHVISLDFIPSTAPKNTLFTIKTVSHTFKFEPSKGNNGTWATKIDCLAHIRPASDCNHVELVSSIKTTGGTGVDPEKELERDRF